MPAQLTALLDPAALAVVVLGTLLGTLARSGLSDARRAIGSVAALAGDAFDSDANRSTLAKVVPEIRSRGPLCAAGLSPPDPVLSDLIHHYLAHGNLDDVLERARSLRAEREAETSRASAVFETAGDLAPVFGLVGTLLAITQLGPVDTNAGNAAAPGLAAVASAVVSTLYGVLSAHLVYLPIGKAIARRSADNEKARAALLEWFAHEVSKPAANTPAILKDVA